jgi:hypothetical protein
VTATATIQESSALDPTAPLAALHPFAPRTLEETGLSHDFLTQLVLKVMHFASDYTGLELAHRVGL